MIILLAIAGLLGQFFALLFHGAAIAFQLAFAAIVTAAVESAVFMSDRRFRKARFIAACLAVNVASNVALNLAMLLVRPSSLLAWPVLYGEALAWTWEFLTYGALFRFSWRLLLYTCLANALTFGLSFLLAA